MVLILDCRSWPDGRWSWFDGPMVVGGGGDGSMVSDCCLMGMGRGSDGSMVVVLVPKGRGSQCSVFNGTVGFGLGLPRSTG